MEKNIESIEKKKGKVLTGQIVSVRPKTIVVKVKKLYRIPKYGKLKLRYKNYHAHDEKNNSKVGEIVSIISSRPLSALKRWVLLEKKSFS